LCFASGILIAFAIQRHTVGGKWENSKVTKIFNDVLDRTKILIHAPTGTLVRDLRQAPFSEGLKGYGLSKMGWHSAFIRVDDAETGDLIDAKADVIFGMYYSEHNADDVANHWGDVPVIVVDGAMFGAYAKDLQVDGRTVYSYKAGVGGFWLHYNLATGEAKVF
jgi:hypothetical protein